MVKKPTYEELEQRIEALEKQAISGADRAKVSGINIRWNANEGTCTFEELPVAMMWVDTTLAGLMSGVQSMVGTERFSLALQSEGRKSVEDDWKVISQFSDFEEGFKAIANIAAVAGWGDWKLISFDKDKQECHFRVKNSWEGRYQKSLGVCWGSGMLAGKMAGYCSKLFRTNCWAKQTRFIADEGEVDEFIVKPSERLIEDEIENLLLTDEATRADMAVALQKLRKEVNERKQAEKELRESEERYRTLFEQGPDGIVVLDPKTAKPIEFNDQVCRQLGYSREEFARLRVSDIEAKESAKETRIHIQKVLSEGHDEFETLHRTKQGDIRQVYVIVRLILLNGLPVYHCIWRDVTERKQLEEARRDDAVRWRILVEQSRDGIVVLDENCRVYESNQKFADMLGYSMKEVHQLHVWDWDAQWTKKELKEMIKAMDVTGYHLETRHLRKDGTLLDVEISTNKALYKGQKLVFCVCRDITDRKLAEEEKMKLEEQLQQAQKMEAIGTLAGGIAHDFNNMLGIILGNAELALEDIPQWNPARHNLEEVKRASIRAKEVVRQLMSFARKTGLDKRPTNITHIVRESLKMLRATIPTSIDIREHISDDIDTVLADPTQINQVMINLCTNSHHAMPDGGVINVTLDNILIDESHTIWHPEMTPGPYVHLIISDTGHGIPKENIDQIFDPYFTTKDVGRGSGMGLAVVHGIIKDHGAIIKVESEIEKGTTFGIFFPVVEQEAIFDIANDDELPVGNEKILFVDDEKSIVSIVKILLKRLGYQVEAKTNSVKALEVFREKPDQFDLVITDMNMPYMTGDKLAHAVKEIRSDVPVILCTGFSEKVDKHREDLEIDDLLMKPIDKAKLAITVRKVLDDE